MMEIGKKIEKFFKILNPKIIFVILGIFLIFSLAIRPLTDPDMGWHLKNGEYILNNLNVAKSDIFSHSMPDFPLIMHEWATDTIMWLIYHNLGLFPLAVFFAIIITLAFLVTSLGIKSKIEYKIIAAILGVIASIPVLGSRPQMLNLLFLAVTIFLILRFRENKKNKIIFFLPLLMFCWVNLHGGFPLGIFFVGTFLAVEFLKLALNKILSKSRKLSLLQLKKWFSENIIEIKSLLKLSLVLIISILTTLANPYGWRVYTEVINTIFDNYAKSNIGEWMPVVFSNPMSYQFSIYLSLFAILLIMSWRKIDYTYLAITAVFFTLGLTSWRHMPIFIIISIPLWVNIVEFLAGKELSMIVFRKFFLMLLALAVVVVLQQQWRKSYKTATIEQISKIGNYPLGAVEYLRKNPPPGNMFNEYNWGGFLIWQYPEKKTYIDGRMPSWRMGDLSIFKEFNEAMQFGKGNEIFEKYGIRFVLVYNNPINQERFNSNGWKEAYSDSLSIIFLRD